MAEITLSSFRLRKQGADQERRVDMCVYEGGNVQRMGVRRWELKHRRVWVSNMMTGRRANQVACCCTLTREMGFQDLNVPATGKPGTVRGVGDGTVHRTAWPCTGLHQPSQSPL